MVGAMLKSGVIYDYNFTDYGDINDMLRNAILDKSILDVYYLLHAAVKEQNLVVAYYFSYWLLKNGASAGIKNNEDQTALDLARCRQNEKNEMGLLEGLIKNCNSENKILPPEVNLVDDNGKTFLLLLTQQASENCKIL